MLLLIIYGIAAIVASFLCSIWEAVLLSISPSYVKKQEGNSIGIKLQKFKQDIDEPLSAILTLNTIAHTVGAILVGVQAASVFENEAYFGVSGEIYVSIIMTIGILLLSEIIPKTIGASMWESLAPFTVKSITVLLVVLKPIIWVTKLITSRFKGASHESVLTRADFMVMTDIAEDSGEINTSESTVISNILKLKDLKVTDVMTPSTVMFTAKPEMNIVEFFQAHKPFKFSRIPVLDLETREIKGIVLKDHLLEELALGNQNQSMIDLAKPANYAQETASLESVLNKMIEAKIHIFIVVDEYGDLSGLITLEDIFETILGLEITDETDGTTDLQELARKRWNERAKKLGLLE